MTLTYSSIGVGSTVGMALIISMINILGLSNMHLSNHKQGVDNSIPKETNHRKGVLHDSK